MSAVATALQEASQAAEAAAHDNRVVALVGAFVGLMVIAAIVDALAKRWKIPFTVALVVVGAGLGHLADRYAVLAPIGSLEVTPEAVFFVFLPTLIFQSAFHLDARALRANLAPTLALAVPGLLISTGVIGAIVHAAAPWVGIELAWTEALLLGSILSATDPVAVVSLFSQLGAPKRLTVLVEGESLFNDATAIVLSRIILGVMAAGTFAGRTLIGGVAQFFSVFFGGLLVGAVLAIVAGLIIGRVRSDAFIEITATTVLAYFSFYLSEHSLGLSGVMAVVAAGVVIGGWGKTKISPSIADYLEHFWDYMAGVANALIFLLVGLTVDVGALLDAVPILAWVVAAMLVSRALVIYGLVPLTGRLRGSEPVSRSYQTVMFWGGLRGGIALAIALSLPTTVIDPGRQELFITLATGAVLFTLIVQGLTIERVVRHFGLHIPPLSDRIARLEGLMSAKLRTLEQLPMLEAGGLFPHHIATSVRRKADAGLVELRRELDRLHDQELDVALERQILYLRSFAEERTLYFELFSKGHVSEGAYRDLVHSIELQSDDVRHEGTLPEFTLHAPTGERLGATILRLLDRGPVLAKLVERAREARTRRDYEIAWARFHGDERVIADLEERLDSGAHRREAVEAVLTSYRRWKQSARNRLDQTAELFPEFVAAAQHRLAERLALQAEKEAIDQKARAGSIPRGVADMMIDDLGHEIRMLSVGKSGELAVDPEELLKKVPYFQGLPREEFRMVAGSLKRRTAPSGDIIVRQGSRGSSLFLVARGVIRVTRIDDGEERSIATLLAGDFFGEMALLHGGTRTATCRAVTPCALYELTREDVEALVKRAPAMKSALAQADRERRSELRAAGADLGEV